MKKTIRLVLCGSRGRMGTRIAALARTRLEVSSLAEVHRGNARSFPAMLPEADVIIDFSAPEASVAFTAAAGRSRIPTVVGTTGFTPSQTRRLKASARRTAVLLAPNCSPGMNLLFELARRAAAALPGYDVVISETHHAGKKDAPSGSAKRLAGLLQGPVQTVSLRVGDVVGDHTLVFAGPRERLELTHRAHDRDLFAQGALDAAVWLAGRKPGLYTMRDMLKL